MKHWPLGFACAAAALGMAALLVFTGGCRKSRSSSSAGRGAITPEEQTAHANAMVPRYLETLKDSENYDSPETVQQAIDRLDQWVQLQQPQPDWKVDPMASPLFAVFAEVAEGLVPIDAALQPRRDPLELKGVARKLQQLPAILEQLGTRPEFKDLDALAQQYEDLGGQLQTVAKQLRDEAKEEQYNDRVLQEFERKVKDEARLARLRELLAIAQQVDDPAKFHDLARLRDFAAQFMELGNRNHPEEYAKAANQFLEIAKNRLHGGQTRLLLQVRFVADQFQNLTRLKGLVAMRELNQLIDRLTERLKTAGNRTNREDIRDLATRFAAAGKKRDLEELQSLVKELEELAKPRDLDPLRALSGELAEPIRQLQQLERRIQDRARAIDLENLPGLAHYCGELGQKLQELGKVAGSLRSDMDPRQLDQSLDAILAGYEELAGRVEMLKNQMQSLADVGKLSFPRGDILAFREALWLRELSHWVRGEEADEISRAKRLFDWTVRNIQLHDDMLVREGSGHPFLRLPWETLFFGQGTAMDRAWVFILLRGSRGSTPPCWPFPTAPTLCTTGFGLGRSAC